MEIDRKAGETSGLRLQDIHEGYIHVEHSWSDKYGPGPTKGKKDRYVPISSGLYNRILALKLELGIQENGHLFPLDGGKAPVWDTVIVKWLNKAYADIGINNKTRIGRKLSFHSWRHKFITDARGLEKEDELLKIVGHEKPSTTDGYDHRRITENQFMTNRQEETI
jgi:integrase